MKLLLRDTRPAGLACQAASAESAREPRERVGMCGKLTNVRLLAP